MNKRTKEISSPLYRQIEEGYKLDPKKPGKYVIKELENRKQMLKSIRDLHKPIDHDELQEYRQKMDAQVEELTKKRI
jgi:hypothetical protein